MQKRINVLGIKTGAQNIVKEIKQYQKKWLQHVQRMDTNRKPKQALQSALHLHTVRPFTEGDDTRGCGDTICPPENEQRAARNMLRIVV